MVVLHVDAKSQHAMILFVLSLGITFYKTPNHIVSFLSQCTKGQTIHCIAVLFSFRPL